MITVLIPTYNSAYGLGRSIRSILNQSFGSFELLVVDDGSTDGTESMMKSFRDERIRYLRLPHQGISAALNAGLSEARFSLIARMDAGDLAHPERLQRQYALIKDAPPEVIVSCHYALFMNDAVQYLVKGSADPAEIRKRLILHPDFPHPGTMYRKQFIMDAGGYREVPLEDYDMWLRIKDSAEFHIIQEILVFVEHHPASLTNSNVRQRYRDHYALQSPYFDDLRSSFGINEESEQMLWKGWREYFYGDPSLARGYFFHSRTVSWKVFTAFILTFLSEPLFVRMKEYRLRQRIGYLLHYDRNDASSARTMLKQIVGKVIGS